VQREIDGQRCYAFAGRSKDVVDRGREKISCEEVEQALTGHPAVSDCAIVGMPDPVLGERACAWIVARPGSPVPSVGELGEFLRDFGLARFKWPERVEGIDVLPLTKVGKLDKEALRTRIAAILERESAEAPARTE
jgi:2,3-dihydroxybenzoate-AMP ligase